ncbi:hypothetical protein N1F89_00830 [Aquibium sp. A9E412]|uniref:hypothetical protein n=1 Tax=Aquibium sp. A9E412 TaxID=2976767 RepID=UPI0025B2264F|nr:hypothetical protein [Aquibium sp. A9E412]MDN2564756.1 hypothetical protein [Aquibium sp. A9E412]
MVAGLRCSSITAVVARDTAGARSLVALEPDGVADQIDAVLDVKTRSWSRSARRGIADRR